MKNKMYVFKHSYSLIIFLVLFTCIHAQNRRFVFDLSGYKPDNPNAQIFKTFINITDGLSNIQITNKSNYVGFFIIQAHTFRDNVTLSYSPTIENRFSIKGRNIGLVSINDTDFYLNTIYPLSVFIVVTLYTKSDPIPGGCNLSFNTQISPYLLTKYTDELIIVEGQPPSAPGVTCEKNKVQIELYHMYMYENEHNADTYYSTLDSMLTVDLIRKNGRRVYALPGYFTYRKLYNSYRGLGQVFCIIATYNNRSAAYIPAVSYGCDMNNVAEDCYGPITLHWKIICAVYLIFGLITNFFGHKFFKITLFLIGLAFGIFISYIVLSFEGTLEVPEKTTTSLVIGTLCAVLWVYIWWRWGAPILSVSLTMFLAAFLIASVVFYNQLADFAIFHTSLFWLCHFCITMASMLIMVTFAKMGHIFACNILGSYACITALSYYTGGNIQYILINSFRRMVVKNFNMATIDPPFQALDITQIVLWIVMVQLGFYYQLKEQRGRPPFPSPRYVVTIETENNSDETTSLLHNTQPNRVRYWRSFIY